MGEYRREIIGTVGSVLGIGFLSTKDSGDVAGPIIVDGSEGGPALEVKEAYLLDNGNKTATFTQYAGEPYEVEGVLQNIGDEAGSRTFDLVVGESVEDERVVELSPAESQTVYFMPNAPSVSEQTTLSIMLGDSAVGELVVEPRVDISVTGAFLLDGSGNRVSSRTLTEGEILDAEADLENAGIDSGDISLALELEGSQLDSATTTVGPDAGVVEQQLSGEVPQVDTSTEYAATIADQSAGTVTVEPAPAIPDSEGLHEWLLDDGSGTTAADRVGNADLSLSGPSWVSGVGVGDYVLDWDGADDSATAADADLNEWGDTGSILFPTLLRDDTSGQAIAWQGGVPRLYLGLNIQSAGGITVGLADTTSQAHGFTTSDINLDSWQGWGLTWDSGSYGLHIYDFPSETMVSGTGTYSGTVSQAADMNFGSDEVGGRNADMQGDFPRIYDAALSQSGVKSRFDEIARFY